MSPNRQEKIIVKRKETLIDKWVFDVSVDDGKSQSDHEVAMQKGYFELFAGKRIEPEVFIEQSFRFLLSHEPKESILRNFDVSKIEEYFSDYRQTLSTFAG